MGSTARRRTILVGGYDPATVIAAMRANSTYGSRLTANHARFPAADGGLALPQPPSGTLTVHTATSVAEFNTLAGGDHRRITLTPGTYTDGIAINGSHIHAIVSGCTISPSDGGLAAIRVTGGNSSHHIFVDGGGTAVCNNGCMVWHPTEFASDLHIKGVDFRGKFSTTGTGSFLGDHGLFKGHRVLLEASRVFSAYGGMFIEGGSTNILAMNSKLITPLLAVNNAHENPFRANGAHLCFAIDSYLQTYYEAGAASAPEVKYCWRSHHADVEGIGGGFNGAVRSQISGGGIMATYPGVATDHPQSECLIFDRLSLYTPSDMTNGIGINLPYLNTINSPPYNTYLGDVMNAELIGLDCTYYWSAGSGTLFGAVNSPPGVKSGNSYAPYVSEPYWDFRTSTPT